ncbi:hypothetical protein QAD02_010239, partial [Eretmocerus hayati]
MGTLKFCVAVCVLFAAEALASKFTVSKHELTVPLGKENSFVFSAETNSTTYYEVFFRADHPSLVQIIPENVTVSSVQLTQSITLKGLQLGRLKVNASIPNADEKEYKDVFVNVTVERSSALRIIAYVIGWIYFAAWSVSFYPQIYTNYKRKSVVGLNFDFLTLNVVGFFLYSLYNCGMFWIPEIERQYLEEHPQGLNPVKPNDVFFSLHAFVISLFTIFQCLIYDRGEQKVSTIARIIHGIFTCFVLGCAIIAVLHYITWHRFLEYCSYVKLTITLIKYVPQAFYNYKRQSTVGWSIGNIFLDFIGGTLSMLQMIFDGINYDDFGSIFGDLTKFGLGFFSVAFDVLFLVQHYVLY